MGYSSTTGFQNDEDHALTGLSSGAEAGSGGGVMAIWNESRQTKLNQFGSAEFTNNSSFGIPAAYLDTTGFQTGFPNGEHFMGVNAMGQAFAADGKPLSGEATLETDEVAYGGAASGLFVISAPPAAGVTTGADVTSSDQYDFRFSPSVAGVDYYQENVGASFDAGTFQYGEVAGTVTDYDGNVVEGAVIAGEGAATKTGPDGAYQIVAPGGTQVTLYGVGHEKTKTPSAGQTITVDWQYARLIVEVVTPDLEPVAGVPVQIGQESYTTNDDGQVVIENALVTTYDVVVSDTYSDQAAIQQEGDRYVLRFGDSGRGGVDLRVVDAATGDPIRDLPGILGGTENRAKSNRAGRLRIVTDALDDGELLVGAGDPRYEAASFDVTVSEGETVAGRLELEPKQQVSNT